MTNIAHMEITCFPRGKIFTFISHIPHVLQVIMEALILYFFVSNAPVASFLQAYWPFPSIHIMEVGDFLSSVFFGVVEVGFSCKGWYPKHLLLMCWVVYILTHPGVPTVFYDHFYDWGDAIQPNPEADVRRDIETFIANLL
ncbi:uncharacterized protein LOC122073252 [Macadamia integrifolia]|uniref:uncharacterized protein LOC122073252 n=1 Tax=Macadamia integrifolia TaxID=60698 RepID=UPI001C4EB89F|nr:uncharacterized protein LOC122073252 [Macadamia integrifolia]